MPPLSLPLLSQFHSLLLRGRRRESERSDRSCLQNLWRCHSDSQYCGETVWLCSTNYCVKICFQLADEGGIGVTGMSLSCVQWPFLSPFITGSETSQLSSWAQVHNKWCILHIDCSVGWKASKVSFNKIYWRRSHRFGIFPGLFGDSWVPWFECVALERRWFLRECQGDLPAKHSLHSPCSQNAFIGVAVIQASHS